MKKPDHPAPVLGQHTREVLLTLGYPAGRIKGLRSHGVLAF